MTPRSPVPGLRPQWPAHPRVGAFVSIRAGGVSQGRFNDPGGSGGGLNLGDQVGDDPVAVTENRARLQASVPGPIHWLRQVHGTVVHHADGPEAPVSPPVADAAITCTPGVVIGVITADCLPILLADAEGRAVGVAHAGWRGLAAGVTEAAVAALRARIGAGCELTAWLGPAIGPTAFEVGSDVRDAFCDTDPGAAAAFAVAATPGKWLANLYALTRRRLQACGVGQVAGGNLCTVSDPLRFYSHRRDRVSGRMASLVWLAGR